MVAGMGLVAGLAASRFLKASSERRYGDTGRVRMADEAGRPELDDRPTYEQAELPRDGESGDAATVKRTYQTPPATTRCTRSYAGTR